jgi:hypothetical protein
MNAKLAIVTGTLATVAAGAALAYKKVKDRKDHAEWIEMVTQEEAPTDVNTKQ